MPALPPRRGHISSRAYLQAGKDDEKIFLKIADIVPDFLAKCGNTLAQAAFHFGMRLSNRRTHGLRGCDGLYGQIGRFAQSEPLVLARLP